MKTNTLILCMLLLTSVATGFAQTSGSCGENLTWTLSEDEKTLTISGTGEMADYSYNTLPWSSYRSSITTIEIGDGVTSIGDYAFYGCSSLTSISVPNGVTSIGDYAFSGCSNLTSVSIGNGVKSIGKHVFSRCTRLTSITIPNNVQSIGFSVFYGCSGLTSISIGSGVTSIADHVFYECKNLASITIPNSVTSIGDEAFYRCENLTSITIGNGVTSIGHGAFYGCKRLTSITIPNNVTSIEGEAFSSCSELISITINNGVTSIGDIAFTYCSSLTSVTIPESVISMGVTPFAGCRALTSIDVEDGNTHFLSEDGVLFNKDKTTLLQYPAGKTGNSYPIPNTVTSIGIHAFLDCNSLTSITIPNSVTSIGIGAFQSCSSLTSITIGKSVTSIGGNAFNSKNLTSFTNLNPIPQNIDYSNVFYNYGSNLGNATLYVPVGSEEAYRSASHWKKFGTIRAYTDESIQIQASPHLITITWSQVEGAVRFLIIIYSDANRTQEIARFELDVNGQLLRSGASTLSYTASDLNLNNGTEYYYSITSYDDTDEVLTASAGNFSVATPTAKDELSVNTGVRVYPNPVSESFRIIGLTAPAQVDVTDVSGKVVLQQTVRGDESITVGHLPKGVYPVRINGETKKIVKN
jgi:hypothetical protein